MGWIIISFLIVLVAVIVALTIALPVLGIYDDVFWTWILHYFIWNGQPQVCIPCLPLTFYCLLFCPLQFHVFFLSASYYMCVAVLVFMKDLVTWYWIMNHDCIAGPDLFYHQLRQHVPDCLVQLPGTRISLISVLQYFDYKLNGYLPQFLRVLVLY